MRPMNKSYELDPDLYYYLATTYSSHPNGKQAAFMDAALIAGELVKQGNLVFAPIVHGHPCSVQASIDEDDYEFWMSLDKKYMGRCDALLVAMMPNWQISKGIGIEIAYAKEVDMPVYYLDLRNNRKMKNPLRS